MPRCVPPWVQFLWDSELPGLPRSLFPSPDWESFPLLFFQISFQLLALPLLLAPHDLDVGMFKVVPEVPKPLLIFLNSCFFILVQLDVNFFLLFQIVDLSPGFLPFAVGSLYIFLYFTLFGLHFFLHFATQLNQFCEHPDYQCFGLCIRKVVFLLFP